MKVSVIPIVIAVLPLGALSAEVEQILVHEIYSAQQHTPISYQTIERGILDKSPALEEPSFLLSKTPAITVYSDSGSYQGYSYVRLRGMDQTRINMTLDGVPLNEPEDQGVYFSNYPGFFGARERVQIQRGVGLSQNGTASFAGSIQLSSVDLTRPPRARLEAGYGSFNTASAAGEYLSGLVDNKSFYVRASLVNSDGYKYDSGNQSHSLFSKGLVQDEFGAWKFLAITGEQRNDMAWLGVSEQAINEDRRANANSNEEDKFNQSLIAIARERKFNPNLQLDVKIYYNHLTGNYDFDLNNFLGVAEAGEVYNYAFDSDFYGAFSTLRYRGDSLSMSGGLEVNQYARDHIGSEKTLGQLYDNTGYKDSYSGFIKSAYEFGKTTLFADLQYRHTDFDYRGSTAIEKMDWSFVNPRAGISIQWLDSLTAYYSLGKTSREPTRTDLFGGSDNLEVDSNGNPALYIVEPERVIDHEVGLRYDNQGRVQAAINAFYMDFDNEITLNGNFGPNALLLTQDVEQSVRQGLELFSELQLSDSFSLTTALAYNDAAIKDEGFEFKPILSPLWLANLGIEYARDKFAVGVDTRYQSSSYLNFANTEQINAFTVVNAYLEYRFERVELQLNINNIFNKDYYAAGVIDVNNMPGYFVAAPVNAQASVKVNL